MALNRIKIANRNYFYMIAGFSIFVILISIILALYTITENYRSLSFLDKAYGTSARIDRIYSILKYAEKQQRAFLISGNKNFPDMHAEAKKDVLKEYKELYNILRNEEEQQMNLVVLKVEIETKLKVLQQGEEFLDSPWLTKDSLRNILARGDFILDKTRETITTMKKLESHRFSDLREETFTKSSLSVFIIAITSGISIVLLISILIALRKEHQTRLATESKLKASEHRLQQQVHMLNISNKELERFAYIASHDLEEPLRKINSLSDMVNIRLEKHDDPEVKDNLRRLNNSVSRMRTLISDLLNYSRVTRILDINEDIDLNEVLGAIAEDLEERLKAKNAKLTIEQLRHVKGNQTQMRQLFQNLISNALKFCDKPTPDITVWGEVKTLEQITNTGWMIDSVLKHKSYYCIYVKDNGIGFDLQYLKQIFVIFQRLHGRSEYEGTGIGLAICKRIAENHDGFITAESIEGTGTTFIIALPVTENI